MAKKKSAAAELGAKGGSKKTPAKVAAVRENGKKGGRPPQRVVTITIQPKMRSDMKLPYPYHINVAEFGMVERQDFWKGSPLKLICFAKQGEHECALDYEKFVKNPKKCIGLYPVFEHRKGGAWYTYEDPIESISVTKE